MLRTQRNCAHLVGTGTSVTPPSIVAWRSRTKVTKGFSRNSTSPTSTLEASASLGIFLMNLFFSCWKDEGREESGCRNLAFPPLFHTPNAKAEAAGSNLFNSDGPRTPGGGDSRAIAENKPARIHKTEFLPYSKPSLSPRLTPNHTLGAPERNVPPGGLQEGLYRAGVYARKKPRQQKNGAKKYGSWKKPTCIFASPFAAPQPQAPPKTLYNAENPLGTGYGGFFLAAHFPPQSHSGSGNK